MSYPFNVHLPITVFKGKSHLASVRIVGNKGYYKRPSHAEDIYHSKVHNDVKLLSYYLKQRDGAKNKRIDIMDTGKYDKTNRRITYLK